MCSRTDWLCAFVATALCYTVTAMQLDMAPNAVDDLYDGCGAQAQEKYNTTALLTEELSHNKQFEEAWNVASKCFTLIPGGGQEHTTAVGAYVNGGHDFINSFNDDVENMGVNVSTYEDKFHFKLLHFLLVDSMKLLNKTGCKTVYRRSTLKYTVKKGSTVRLGHFTTASISYQELKEDPYLEGGTFFNITSCFVANLGDNPCLEDEDMDVILSPAEVFTVEEIRDVAEDYKHTEIVLMHSEVHSKHNCYSFSGSPAVSSTLWLVLVLMAMATC
ncbi:T-cell ecto-ADP-ribosyltransferase 1-like [Genypterus blacodes]|uniref:T-cell ecto-ADP-ribosyltransferase 1-like n=1 Tax=Genypterus blacodes TaxID=154954 RepID=UPI003F769958